MELQRLNEPAVALDWPATRPADRHRRAEISAILFGVISFLPSARNRVLAWQAAEKSGAALATTRPEQVFQQPATLVSTSTDEVRIGTPHLNFKLA
ncbi:MAG: hypothetical protein DMG24_22230 [Acidobacteria bacterium]|nr:MAG: hypothetical protein DMG24_22230 [Acidobacteriota bacterium]